MLFLYVPTNYLTHALLFNTNLLLYSGSFITKNTTKKTENFLSLFSSNVYNLNYASAGASAACAASASAAAFASASAAALA